MQAVADSRCATAFRTAAGDLELAGFDTVRRRRNGARLPWCVLAASLPSCYRPDAHFDYAGE